MRALQVPTFGDPNVLTLTDLPDPEAGAGEIVVEIKAVGVNPVDTYLRSGGYPSLPDLPYVPHGDAAGVVAELGEGVESVAVGDRVFVSGTTSGRLAGAAAEFATCHAADVFPLPDGVGFEQGAAVNVPYATAFRALIDHAKLKPSDRLLVHGGSGGVGLAAIQIAKAHGVTTYATAGTDAGRELCREHGAAVAVGHDELGELPEPPTVILEMLANVSLPAALAAIAPGGRVVVVGSRGEVAIDPRVLMTKHPILTGMNLYDGGAAAVRRALTAVSTGLSRGDLSPVIADTYPLHEAAAAHEAVMRDGKRGQVVLTI